MFPAEALERIKRRTQVADRGHATPCWEWRGYTRRDGYGMLGAGQVTRTGRRKPSYVHVVGYVLSGGHITDGRELDHLCRNRRCWRPSHLEAVDHRTNVARGASIVAGYIAAAHHKCGHPKGGEHTYIRPDGRGTFCGTCARQRARDAYRRAG